MAGTSPQLVQLVEGARRGEAAATDELVPLLYGELRRLAAALMARERGGGTLQPTALVHEAYLRLLGDGVEWQSRAHFLGAAACAMRRILIERARRRARSKRGGGRERVTLTEGTLRYEPTSEGLLALDAALLELQARDADMARVVELRYFGGLTLEETAEVLHTSARSVNRLWAAARAWLHRALAGTPISGDAGG